MVVFLYISLTLGIVLHIALIYISSCWLELKLQIDKMGIKQDNLQYELNTKVTAHNYF